MICSRWFQQTLFCIALAGAYFFWLGDRGLNEPDEARYAEIGREMAISSDWVTPHLNGFAHFQKPPIIYWLTAAAFKLFGVNEWSARLPSTLAALGTLALASWMAGTLFGKAATRTAALILSSSMLFFILARFLTPDMVLTFFITASIACLVRWQQGGGRIWTWLFFVMMGIGFLTKGPMALIIPISSTLGWRYALRRDGQSLALALPWWRGLLLTFAIGISWFVVMVVLYPELVDYFLRYELLNRFASHTHGRSKPIWFFIPVLTAGLLPWTFFAPLVLRDSWQHLRAKQPIPSQWWLLLGWFIPPLVILSLSGSKLITYVLPLLPACALLLTGWWHQKNRPLRSLYILSGLTLAFLLFLTANADRWNNHFGRQASIRPLAARILLLSNSPHTTVFTCNVRTHGLEFYLQKWTSTVQLDADIVLPLTLPQFKRVFLTPLYCEYATAKEDQAYGIVRQADFERYFSSEKWERIDQAGDFLLIGRRQKTNVPSTAPSQK